MGPNARLSGCKSAECYIDCKLLSDAGVPKYSELEPDSSVAKRNGNSAAEFMVMA